MYISFSEGSIILVNGHTDSSKANYFFINMTSDGNQTMRGAVVYIEGKDGHEIKNVTLCDQSYCMYEAAVYKHLTYNETKAYNDAEYTPVDGHYLDDCSFPRFANYLALLVLRLGGYWLVFLNAQSVYFLQASFQNCAPTLKC